MSNPPPPPIGINLSGKNNFLTDTVSNILFVFFSQSKCAKCMLRRRNLEKNANSPPLKIGDQLLEENSEICSMRLTRRIQIRGGGGGGQARVVEAEFHKVISPRVVARAVSDSHCRQ